MEEEFQPTKKSGMPYGLIWGVLFLSVYAYLFFFFGVYFIWDQGMPDTFGGLLLLAGSSFVYLIAGILGFVPVFITSIIFIIRDRNLRQSIKNNWPVLLALIYPILPNLPGPIDESVMSVVMFCIRVYLFFRTGKDVKEAAKK
ncbi:MAG TPA: hypothetical protein PK079_06440 [Leptospiraceae bacterium]|nr:hypothetical protein [Leptospiraceae bacterium]HMW06594.1 hypothetical protein [Leptospiraceae bacterium]HMX32022.1 hypothetical protein [Leptospiraceae bacterium]HMY31215.1 hypothetical protein [Leptospiraceae bacterium]HMZ63298.1 hypothetical protein [Leptospiraceae bacterium]